MVCLKKKKKGMIKNMFFIWSELILSPISLHFRGKAVTASLGLSLTRCLARWAGKQGKKTELSGRISPVTTLEQAGRMPGTGDFCYLSATLALGRVGRK